MKNNIPLELQKEQLKELLRKNPDLSEKEAAESGISATVLTVYYLSFRKKITGRIISSDGFFCRVLGQNIRLCRMESCTYSAGCTREKS